MLCHSMEGGLLDWRLWPSGKVLVSSHRSSDHSASVLGNYFFAAFLPKTWLLCWDYLSFAQGRTDRGVVCWRAGTTRAVFVGRFVFVAPSKVPPSPAHLRCDTETQNASLVCASTGQAGKRGFEKGWFGPLKPQTERQLPTPKYKDRSLSVQMQRVRGGAMLGQIQHGMPYGAWALAPGSKLWRKQMFLASCTSLLDLHGRDKISWQSYTTTKQKSSLYSGTLPTWALKTIDSNIKNALLEDTCKVLNRNRSLK